MTHLISEYAELEEEDIQEIDRNIKEPISGKTLFEEFVEQIEWNQENRSRAESVFSGSDCFNGLRQH